MNCECPWYENEWRKGRERGEVSGPLGRRFMLMQVFRAEESIIEVDAAPAQVRRKPREWYFGDKEFSGRQRDVENRTVVGGMRRPVETHARAPGLRCVGVQQRQGLERLVDLHPELLRLAVRGQGGHAWAEFRPWFESTLVDTVAAILEVLGEHATRRGSHSSWRPLQVRAFVEKAKDPEIHLVDWLEEGAPIGVARAILAAGIFPLIPLKTSDTKAISSLYSWNDGHIDCVSVSDGRERVETELARLVEKGYITKYVSWDAWCADYQGVIVSKLAANTKERADGTVKLRLIVDMRRSGLNEHVVLNERIVLPRVRDAVKDVMSLMAQPNSEGIEVEPAVVDFVDAYQTIGPRRAETPSDRGVRRCLLHHALRAGSPLILEQSITFPGSIGTVLVLPETRMEIYVDDPFVGSLGHTNATVAQAHGPYALAGITWDRIVLGKSSESSRVNWIGAEVVVDSPKSMTVCLPAEFVFKALGQHRHSHRCKRVDRVHVKRYQNDRVHSSTTAGRSSLLGCRHSAVLRGHVMWVAMSPGKHPPEARIPRRRITQACSWLVNVLRRQTGALRRTYEMDRYFSEPTFVITVDASPWGLGGFLSFRGRAIGWFAERVEEHDVQRFGIEIGSHEFETLLEALAVLVAVRWSSVWTGSRASLRVWSDSLSTLGAINKLRSRTPRLAAIMRELALDCSEGVYTLQVLAHPPGIQNEWTDALSRIWQPGQVSNVSVELMAVTQYHPTARLATWWKLPGAEHKATRLQRQEKRCERSETKEEVQCAWTFTWGQDPFCCGKGLREHSLREEARRVNEQTPPRVTTRGEDQYATAKQRSEFSVEATWGESTDVMLDVRETMSTRTSRTRAVHGD